MFFKDANVVAKIQERRHNRDQQKRHLYLRVFAQTALFLGEDVAAEGQTRDRKEHKGKDQYFAKNAAVGPIQTARRRNP